MKERILSFGVFHKHIGSLFEIKGTNIITHHKDILVNTLHMHFLD